MATTPEELFDYWMHQVGPDKWFTADPARDAELTEKFLADHDKAANGGLQKWESNPTGMLGLMLLLDQFPRHMFRGTPRVFATDHLALELARTAIIKHFDDRIDAACKLCFYLPFSRAENISDQRLALYYIRERTKNPAWLNYVEQHYHAIHKFGRFPERNQILGRPTTSAESEYLKRHAAGF